MKFLLQQSAAALFLDPGLGKTSISLGALKIKFAKKLVNKVLIIAPVRVCHLVWPKELEKWKDFHGLKMEVLHGKDKEEALKRKAQIYVINPEGLDWLLGTTKERTVGKDGKTRVKVTANLKLFKSYGFDGLIIDELSKFKNTDTLRFKAFKQVLHFFKFRWGLTGSPAANGLMGLFGQCFMLDQGRTFGPYITKYRNDYFLKSANGFGWVLQKGAESRIYKRVEPLALRMAAEDYLDMPKLIDNDIIVELPEAAMKIYRQLQDDLISKIEDKLVTAATSGVAAMKCGQVANGAVYLDQEIEALVRLPKSKNREFLVLHDEKIDALSDLIDELQGNPLLVAYEFQHDLARLKKKFGDDIPYIGKGVSTARLKQVERDWNAGKIEVLYGHPQSMAHGLNLQEIGNHICWFGLTHDYELYDQFIRRILRQGNKHKSVNNHRIIAKDTVDENKIYSVTTKDKGQSAFFTALTRLKKFQK